jgi:hypothetical protein
LVMAVCQNAPHIEELSIDFANGQTLIRWSHVHVGKMSQKLKQILPGCGTRIYLNLRVFSLSFESLHIFGRELMTKIDFEKLERLKLQHCKGWAMFLARLQSSGTPLRIKILEIQHQTNFYKPKADATLSSFIGSFEGLEELFLFTDTPSDNIRMWSSVLRHKSTLQRFVHHQRSDTAHRREQHRRELLDNQSLSITPAIMDRLVENPSLNPFIQTRLQCIGICCPPQLLVNPFRATKLRCLS